MKTELLGQGLALTLESAAVHLHEKLVSPEAQRALLEEGRTLVQKNLLHGELLGVEGDLEVEVRIRRATAPSRT